MLVLEAVVKWLIVLMLEAVVKWLIELVLEAVVKRASARGSG